MEHGYKKAVGNLTSQIDAINLEISEMNKKFIKMESMMIKSDQSIEILKNNLTDYKDLCISKSDETALKMDDTIINHLKKHKKEIEIEFE